jgi:UDP-N-acetylglucosamine diphosphorylase/glucosamine-1-phosphate N-acetyltransferase
VIVLYDDRVARGFEPFATSRPLGEMRAGALLIRERWERVLGDRAHGFVAAPHLRGFAEFEAPIGLTGAEVPAGAWVVNSRALPFVGGVQPTASVVTIGGRVAARRMDGASAWAPFVTALQDGSFTLDDGGARPEGTGDAAAVAIEGVWLDEVWDIVGQLPLLLARDIPYIAAELSAQPVTSATHGGVVVIGAYGVHAEPGATVEPMTIFDTTAGPVLLRHGAQVQAFTRVVGPCYIGCDTVVAAGRVAGSSLGDQCRVHGELSSSVFVGHSNKGHDGFVGHSILGRWVNLGAGTTTSNLKNSYGPVSLWTPSGVRNTDLQFLGTLFGDHVKTGIGLRLTTGCVLGAGANVLDGMPPKVVAPFAWGTGVPYERFEREKFLHTAGRMMARRGVTLHDAAAAWWREVYMESAGDPRWPRD